MCGRVQKIVSLIILNLFICKCLDFRLIKCLNCTGSRSTVRNAKQNYFICPLCKCEFRVSLNSVLISA